jgi:hypothetical protein
MRHIRDRDEIMLIHIHRQATITPKFRAAIRGSGDAVTVLLERFGVESQAMHKSRKRDKSIRDSWPLGGRTEADSTAQSLIPCRFQENFR